MSGLFPAAPASVSLARQIECAERELRLRRSVYPRRIENRQMTQAKADEEIACMEAVLVTLKSMRKE